MSFRPSYRRVSLRAALAAAVLASAVLAPATAALADSAPAAPAAGQGQQATDEGTPVRTDLLKGGLTARVFKHGDQHIYYTAAVLNGSKELGTLRAGGGYAAEDSKVFDGIEVTLDFTGAVTSAVDAGSDGQGPVTPAGVLVHTDRLKGDLTAKVYKHGDTDVYYSADIDRKGKVLAGLVAGFGHGKQDTKVYGDISVTLHSDGRITSADDHGSDGQGPVTPVRCVATVNKDIGAGTTARLSTGPSGPSVVFLDAGSGKVVGQLSRLHPKLPASAGFLGEIIGPDSVAPRLRTNMEGGGHPASVTEFPELPAGCSYTYTRTSGNGSETQTSQTSVVPKGSVAAGAEIEQHGSPVLIAVGGAAAAGAAGLGFVVLRRRTAAAGR
ncbi:hypothetical protein [Streptomyces sp. NBC_01104]|uniref:hypothetical protein n=1 Tax=Streptomyces sp. NBC_01104 TaxID=2903750 RepID=UPI00386376F7|nr:hypothetical protein OG450_24860 [Streptomyces sp. NBC_01104]